MLNNCFLFCFQVVRERNRERERSREDRVSGGGVDRDHVSLDDDDDLSPTSSVKRERQDSFEGRSHNGSPIGGANIRIANRGNSTTEHLHFFCFSSNFNENLRIVVKLYLGFSIKLLFINYNL